MQELRTNYNGINVAYLKAEIIRLAKLNGLEYATLNKLRKKSEVITEYERIFLASSIKNDPNAVPEQAVFLSKKEARKALTEANKEVKSISGLIRLINAFEEYHPVLKAYNIDVTKLSPKYIKSLWKKDYINSNGEMIEDYMKKNPLYNQEADIQAQRDGKPYTIKPRIKAIRIVETFSVNKLIKYCSN